jgi:hypothetical protein
MISTHPVGGHYPSFIAHTGSCARPKPSCLLQPQLGQQVFVPQGGTGRWHFPTLSLQSVRRCLDPYPAMSFPCPCPLLPGRQWPHLTRHRFGTPTMLPALHLQQGFTSRGCRHSTVFRLPRSLGPKVAPTAEALSLQGGRAVFTTHSLADYSPKMWHHYASDAGN